MPVLVAWTRRPVGTLARWIGWPGAALAVALAVFVLGLGLGQTAPLHIAENRLIDLRLSLSVPRRPVSEAVTVIVIDEATLQGLPYREPQDRALLAALVRQANAAGAEAIALDLLFGQETEPGKDDALAAAIAQSAIPVIIGDPGQSIRLGLTESQQAFMAGYAPEARRALPAVGRDPDDNVSRFVLRHDPADPSLPTLAAALAEIAGAEMPPDGALIDYQLDEQGRPRPFPVMSAGRAAVLPPPLAKRFFEGRLLLVGIDVPLKDRHDTPLRAGFGDAGDLPGVFLHAHILTQALEGREIGQWEPPAVMLLAALASGLGVAIGYLQMHTGLRAVLIAGALALTWGGALWAMAAWKLMVPMVLPGLLLVFGLGAGSFVSGRKFYTERRFIRQALAQYVPEGLVDTLQRDPKRLRLGGEEREITALFTDVAGFTSTADKAQVAILLPALNRYLDLVCDTVLSHGGMVDKFIGDGVMALFNAPLEQEGHAARAIDCAREIARRTADLAAQDVFAGLGWGHTRVGVHTGRAMIGNVGGARRFDYTAIGDTINTAARLESASKGLGTQVLISEATLSRAIDQDPAYGRLRPVGAIVVVGRETPVTVYEPFAASAAYREGYRALAEGDASAARAALERVHAGDGEDGQDFARAAFHLKRLEAGETSAVMRLKEK